ncbi:MAG: TAT-variant-translocated molybdopterin oxidoreductase [Melioribacteraceae bacterium]|nr:TAT-variant-translocated molybdopterin oxidoreductase [Melioribacteraceae bacterium]
MSKIKNDKNFWKSLKEYYNDPDVLKSKSNEFADGVTEDFNPSELSPISRRNFLALLTASAAFTATACSDYQDKGEIIAYNKRPEGIIPGKPNFYASTCTGCSNNCGVLVKTREGRPIKLDGNPDNPINKGKICATGEASILNLYDPDRLSGAHKNRRKVDWKSIDSEIIDILNKAVSDGKEIALITKTVTSPTYKNLLTELQTKYKTLKIYSYEMFDDLNKRNAWEKSYGTRNYPSLKLDEANIILSLESDFLGKEGNCIEAARKYAAKRDVMQSIEFNRLYVVEGMMSLTGMNADYRFRLRPDYQKDFVLSLITEITNKNGKSLYSNSYSGKEFCTKYGFDQEKYSTLVQDLLNNQGKSIVLAGNSLSEETHILVNYLNDVLENSALYDNNSINNELIKHSSKNDWKELESKIKNKTVSVVINAEANPVFDLSASFINEVETKISLVDSENETSSVSNYVLPINHALESWGDYNSRSNLISLQQPVINPIFDTRQKENIILTWVNGHSEAYSDDAYHQYLKNSFKENVYSRLNTPAAFDRFWFASLHDGAVQLNNETTANQFYYSAVSDIKVENKNNSEYLVHLQKSYYIGDGKFAGNGWLQEMPHPVTKVTWDNFAAVSPLTAKSLDVEMNDLVEVTTDGKNVKLPVIVQPGMADNLIAVELGYGREVISDSGKNTGTNANILLNGKGYFFDVNVSKAGGTYKLASTQEHHSLDDTFVKDFHRKRKIIQEGTVKEYQKDNRFLDKYKYENFDITKGPEYTGLKWGMAIDLNKCLSCGTCVTACNVENNVPVVGKDQVLTGREMQWIRLDRYYSGTPEEPIVSNQPMLCQHCDNAPCENVCPVNATNHSTDGLNQMAYNRCVGTRYCANNCPYKVRRFNFYNFRDHFANAYYQNDVSALAHNPEVTVRSRGVMEKCTFCVQRIMEAREDAIRENKPLTGDMVTTACQQACPTDAIVFGDSNDKNSKLYKYRNHELGYHVLEVLNVRPNVTYLAKLRNTHSEEV